MEALQTATVRVVAVIAEGVPEKDTKQMIAYARANNKVIIGPATVGGVQVRHQPIALKTIRGITQCLACCRLASSLTAAECDTIAAINPLQPKNIIPSPNNCTAAGWCLQDW